MRELRAGKTVVTGNVTIVPVERTVVQFDTGGAGGCLFGLKEPFALIVCDGDGIRAVTMEAREIPLESLLQKIANRGALPAPFFTDSSVKHFGAG